MNMYVLYGHECTTTYVFSRPFLKFSRTSSTDFLDNANFNGSVICRISNEKYLMLLTYLFELKSQLAHQLQGICNGLSVSVCCAHIMDPLRISKPHSRGFILNSAHRVDGDRVGGTIQHRFFVSLLCCKDTLK